MLQKNFKFIYKTKNLQNLLKVEKIINLHDLLLWNFIPLCEIFVQFHKIS